MTTPNEMTVISIPIAGGPDVLQPTRAPIPKPQANELLVEVHAAGVNRPDVLQRLGKYPVPAGANPIPGLEIAGVVVAMGSSVTDFKIGDRVCALTNGGGYAEYCVVPAGQSLPWPKGFTAIQAAALPETFFTVWANLFQIGRAQRGESVLIHGGTSGIGTTAILLSKLFGLHAIATAGSSEKCSAIANLGATAVNYRDQDFVEVVKSQTQGRGVDLVLDIVGASYLQRNLASLAIDGRLLIIGFLGGSVAEKLDLAQILAKRLVITGSAMRPRTAQEKTNIARELADLVWPHFESGAMNPIIEATFSLTQASAAHRLMESGGHIGKIVLTIKA